QVKLAGTAATTRVDATITEHKPGDWMGGTAEVSAALDAKTSAGLARQFGLAAVPSSKDVPAHVDFTASGVPSDGLDTTSTINIAGITAKAAGKVTLGEGFQPAFAGSVDLNAPSTDLALAMAGLAIPHGPTGSPVMLTGDFALGATG